jgi:hypothetical protein
VAKTGAVAERFKEGNNINKWEQFILRINHVYINRTNYCQIMIADRFKEGNNINKWERFILRLIHKPCLHVQDKLLPNNDRIKVQGRK